MKNTRARAAQRLVPSALVATTALLLSACIVEKKSDSSKADSAAASPPATLSIADTAIIDTIDVSAPAYDSASLDTAGLGSQIGALPPVSGDTAFKHINPNTTDARLSRFPARIPTRGPAVLQLEILLDRANFSPGIIDGTWGANAARALTAFRIANGMDSATATSESAGANPSDSSATPRGSTAKAIKAAPRAAQASRPKSATASIDRDTYDKLVAAAQTPDPITSYQVTADDVKGPFVDVPNLVYDQAKLKCLCYTSPAEELAERFHTNQQVLQQLNPGVDLKSLAAGTSIQVPNVQGTPAAAGAAVAKIVISKKGYSTNVVDSSGNVVAHFPSTLGAGYDPSPTGDFHITGIAHNPSFKYQPALMAEVPDTRPTAKLPPGPNSPVGVVWMALSKPHYGIHGTSSPETIGYANSHGCVRLTNWDAERLSQLVKVGTPVQFQ
jgi:lipoprotein-anchoring transpeptidase ErfK/SrfK